MNAPRLFLVAALAALIVACGGGTGGTGATNTVSIGVMTKGSVILNGVHFSDTNATVVIDDTSRTTQIDTRDGMVVKLAGMVNGDGITGSAQQVRALVEVRGTPTNVNAGANPPSLVVQGQTVLVDDQTVYSGLLHNFASITVNVTLIEVHGLRDSAGNIRATRIEANQAQMADATVDEIRGVVSNANTALNPTTFKVGTQNINVVNGATIVPSGATYGNGSVVEVHCSLRPCVTSGAFQASVVQVEEDEDIAFQPNPGERYEVEGLVSGFVAAATTFFVGSAPVTINSSTTFEGGLSTDLANDVQVEAEGSWNGTTLLATKIEFKRSVIRLQGATANRDMTANTFQIQIAGITTITIQLDSFTNGALPADGLACVQVRGARQSPNTPVVVIADEIDLSCSNGGRNFIQAPVEVKIPVSSITLLNTPIDVSSPPQFQGLNGPLSPADFFNTITVTGVDANGISQPGTLVKVTFDPGSTVNEVEIEDQQ